MKHTVTLLSCAIAVSIIRLFDYSIISPCLSAGLAAADASPTNTLTVAQKVEILWTAHTNRLAHAEAARAKAARPKPAIQQVRENAERHKRRSGFGKSAGGVKK